MVARCLLRQALVLSPAVVVMPLVAPCKGKRHSEYLGRRQGQRRRRPVATQHQGSLYLRGTRLRKAPAMGRIKTQVREVAPQRRLGDKLAGPHLARVNPLAV